MKRPVASFLLLFGGMASAFCFGILSLILYVVSGGFGAVLIPLVIYSGVRFAEKYREWYKVRYRFNSALFIAVAELPSVIVSGIIFVLLLEDKSVDLMGVADNFIGAALAVSWGGAALLIMLGTVISSIVSWRTRKNILSQPTEVEETTEV